jgi:ParB family chromosome partitioning protein
VANSLRLLKLSETIRLAIEGGEISSGHARALLSVEDEAARETLFEEIKSQSLNVRDAEKLAQEASGKMPASGSTSGAQSAAAKAAPKTRDPNLAALEQKFIDALGTKVSIEGNWKKGRLVIDYYSMEDLDSILRLLSRQ